MRKRARTDLCGGRSVMTVPTATVNFSIADQPTIDHALNKRDVINFACAGTFRREAKRRPDERHTRTIEESRGPSHQVIALPELG